MSKQLKYRFKKILKKAEFIHADLEYHREVLPEAKKLFSEAVAKIINNMPPQEQKELEDIRNSRLQNELLTREKNISAQESNDAKARDDEVESSEVEAVDNPTEAKDKENFVSDSRRAEIKKLFRQIAEQTHPDKTQSSGRGEAECAKLEAVFKKAQEARDAQNWYLLYCIAIDLDLPVESNISSQKCLEWVEEDIRQTMVQISEISKLLAWVWLEGDTTTREAAVQDYFRQMYGRGPTKTSTD
jgi:hypothetical protein